LVLLANAGRASEMPGGRGLRKLAIVVPALDGGGGLPSVARFVRDTAQRCGVVSPQLVSLCMSSRDHASVELRRPRSWIRGTKSRKGHWEGSEFTHVGAFLSELEFQRYRPRAALSRVLADCDLIQVVCGSPAWANAVIGLGKPIALQVATRARVERRQRDASPRRMAAWWRKAMTEITSWLDDRALRSVDAIQVENHWMLDYARQLNQGRSVDLRYAPPGVDTDLFRPLAERCLSRDRYILCVGRLDDPRKNVRLLLEAYAFLPQQIRDNVRLVLAGSAGPSEVFWGCANALAVAGRVSYVPRPDAADLVRLYQHASVFALPSDEEGLGMVVLEAMACGVPVIATRGGGPDGIITDREDGYLVPLDDAFAMGGRLQELLCDGELNRRMGERARQTVLKRYDERVAGDVFVDTWERMLIRREAY
jgi:D-inositol-3-phosphate glycosyltransferase